MLAQCQPKQTITLDGVHYNKSHFQGEKLPDFVHQSSFHFDVYQLIKAWFSDSPTIEILTSGSTSNSPKALHADRTMMVNSVKYTQDFFQLKAGDTALLNLPLGYIAGTMVVIRALVIGMDLHIVPCCGRPLEEARLSPQIPLTFASMTPLQIYNSLRHESDKARLATIKNLIVVGGPIDAKTEKILRTFPNNIYSTYGMAETLTHIAFRRISGSHASDRYMPLEQVFLSLNSAGALVINAPLVAAQPVSTKDLAEIFADGSFKLLGRIDNVINSGGIKVSAEYIEGLLQPVIEGMFAISSIADPKFGQAIVLVTEKEVNIRLVNQCLPAYYRPKKVIQLDEIPLTKTEKINRGLIKQLLHNATLENGNGLNADSYLKN